MHSVKIKPTGMHLILQERTRQIQKEGYTVARDRQYTGLQLLQAANCYETPEEEREYLEQDDPDAKRVPVNWPGDPEFWKPTPDNRVRELVIAGALYVAENDRLGYVAYTNSILRIALEIDSLIEQEGRP